MSLVDRINEDIKTAMREKNQPKLLALRAVKSELLLLQTSGSEVKITEEDEIKVLQKMVKQRKDSAEIFQSQNREELYQKEMQEVSYLEPYLPKQLTDEELTEVIKEYITKTGATSVKEMGKVIGLANKELAGKAEGKLIAAKVKSLLS